MSPILKKRRRPLPPPPPPPKEVQSAVIRSAETPQEPDVKLSEQSSLQTSE
ncbi:MAG: hypothetical protein KDC43_07300 [Saprospiraceae bacterium]|nr:hypothetical protein [Saprospiraceae bacterium]MCB0623712.1 hypothetical protein [Saprospiraceae bacterium]MCB0675258.1 hypothetical protein [Saprospiraceae bacterium]MCB0679627.1 hypothetical protein [Saprospiraceae bacterium]